ncbi:hypothetical protein MUA02_16530 [Enterobacteriaceae bacterium H20N1]|uniref:DNA utilization protein HofO C-terminal domain-containing protein n=1 Tax=Dryocola boscaweniae TaxID=2925397 RepID=A0A9X2W980_9ENTR|nr:hypothetical protein [Dryocola boscaweniae]MCT4703463.1 hypothetical protein [Dryocola boscaweniae]MCT4720631.1 hypothetical protein [Dryocola boscaweniae]
MLSERWLTAPRWVKCASMAAVNGAAIILLVCFVMQPQQAKLQKSLFKNQQESRKITLLRHSLVSLVSSTRETGQHIAAAPLEHFSAVDLAHHCAGKLEKWQPESKPAMLEMLLPWEKLPSLFARLSGYRAVALQSFIVEPKGELLKLTMALDFIDEP